MLRSGTLLWGLDLDLVAHNYTVQYENAIKIIMCCLITHTTQLMVVQYILVTTSALPVYIKTMEFSVNTAN